MRYKLLMVAAALMVGACGGSTVLETTTSSTSGTGGGDGAGGDGGGGSSIPKECQDPNKQWIDEAFTVQFGTGNWINADDISVTACLQYMEAACAFAPVCTDAIGLHTAQMVCDTLDGTLHVSLSCASILATGGENAQQLAYDTVLVGMDCYMEFVVALPGDDSCVGGGGAGGG